MKWIIVLLALVGCSSPVNLEVCADGGALYVTEAPQTQAETDALLRELGFAQDLPDGFDCATWTVYTRSGRLLGFTHQYVQSRKQCFLWICRG